MTYPNYTAVNYEAQAEFNFGAQGINSQYPAGTPGSRVVQDGDTLRGIAQSTYGNGALWYVIAEANGLSSDADLVSGHVLKLPPVVDSANNVETFRPYDPSRIANDTPTGLPIPRDSGGGCGGIAQIIVVIVAVVVTIYTAGAAASLLAPAGSAAAATTGIGATMSLGASVLGGTAGLGAAGAAAAVVGGAVGSIVSQGVGMAIGVQDSFSWKGVALSAVSAGVTAGMGGAGLLAGKGWESAVARAAVGNTLTQGIAVATGLQSSFSWKSVAISAVSAGLSYELNSLMGYKPHAQFNLSKSLATSVGGSVVTQLAVNGRINTTQLATDAFGNVIGDFLATSSASGGASLFNETDWGNVPADQGYGYDGSPGGITNWRANVALAGANGPMLSDSATNAQIAAYDMSQAGFGDDWGLTPTVDRSRLDISGINQDAELDAATRWARSKLADLDKRDAARAATADAKASARSRDAWVAVQPRQTAALVRLAK